MFYNICVVRSFLATVAAKSTTKREGLLFQPGRERGCLRSVWHSTLIWLLVVVCALMLMSAFYSRLPSDTASHQLLVYLVFTWLMCAWILYLRLTSMTGSWEMFALSGLQLLPVHKVLMFVLVINMFLYCQFSRYVEGIICCCFCSSLFNYVCHHNDT